MHWSKLSKLLIAGLLLMGTAEKLAADCCRTFTTRCKSSWPNIPCQHCVDGDCAERARYYSTYQTCSCGLPSGQTSCFSAPQIYCAYEYNCMEVPAGCANPTLKYCTPDWNNPIPYTPLPVYTQATAGGGACG